MSTPAPRRSRRAVAPVTDPSRSARQAEAALPAPHPTPPEVVTAPERTLDPPAPDGPPPPARVAATAGSGRRWSTVALGLVAALTLAGAAACAVRVHQLRSTDSAANLALVDTPRTEQAISAVSDGLNRIFTYDSTNPAATSKAAAEVLVGNASSQYAVVFDSLQKQAKGQQLELRATTVRAGVSQLTPDSARLLVFLDQHATRVSDSFTQDSASQLAVSAVRQDGVWKISEIRPL